jgi:hypothetical protein
LRRAASEQYGYRKNSKGLGFYEIETKSKVYFYIEVRQSNSSGEIFGIVGSFLMGEGSEARIDHEELLSMSCGIAELQAMIKAHAD